MATFHQEEVSLSNIPIIKIPMKPPMKKAKESDNVIYKPLYIPQNNSTTTTKYHQFFVESPIFTSDIEDMLKENKAPTEQRESSHQLEKAVKSVCEDLIEIVSRTLDDHHSNVDANEEPDTVYGNPLQPGLTVNSNATKDIHYWTCKTCGLNFASHSAYTSHQKLHLVNQLFSCFQCQRRYKTRRALQRHERTHLVDRPVKCSLCGKGFLHPFALSKHKIRCELLLGHGNSARGIYCFLLLKILHFIFNPRNFPFPCL